ncbi:MAG: bifunctional 4-hydroxy-2-oxoglutarate aldolase/2-dehydro-3-deoxy-phosphogluconate aldolase [Oscillospiraceae bacterium]|jgi:2-dehydro-3-deoxyphosphogluconate aldolase/(4S)-4-hydroxy-2-oxoglutarate aldolase|nr:bifunctional 4-hydroxy-2-oxoglutarate aldolase/2-dehydro-3-deoxy-phosphogluconate aldolase [Oscillospiraceae bacterium]
MSDILCELAKVRIVPVIALNHAENAVPLARALIAGGIPCAEITFRTEAGQEAIRRIADAKLPILLGAGTVLSTAQVDAAIAAGASFIVSPGYNPKVVEYCIGKGYPILPGCATPSDMEMAIEAGLTAVKFFPAEQAGGLPYIKACAAPYPMLKFVPTGGINAENVAKYLAFPKVLACGGSWMCPTALIDAGSFGEITYLCRQAVEAIQAI